MVRVIVVGGGLSGCAASIAARKAGAEVILLERTDLLIGAGIRAGRVGGNGEYTAIEEAKLVGGGDIFQVFESIMLHRVSKMIGEKHRYVYNVSLAEPAIRKLLETWGVKIRFGVRAGNVEKTTKEQINSIILVNKEKIKGDVFIDCTGTSGGVGPCTKYGKRCVMCYYYRCPVFGDRISIAAKAGAQELSRKRPDGTPGQLVPAITMFKETLAPKLRARIEREGTVILPLPDHLINPEALKLMGAPRTKAQVEHVNLTDIGPVAKWSAWPFIPFEQVRTIPGFENAQLEGPPGSRDGATHITNLSITPREDSLRAEGFENLFIAGEKQGCGGVVPAVLTGFLAGHNAVRVAVGKDPLVLPRKTALGDFLSYLGDGLRSGEWFSKKYSMATYEYWERMQAQGLYTTDKTEIKKRIEDADLTGVYTHKLT